MSGNMGKGRPAGSRNKRTIAMMEKLGEGETPCEFALRLMRDEQQPQDIRLNAARIAAPYLHPKPQPEPRLVSFELPESIENSAHLMQAHANLLRATATGELALDEAREISIMLDAHRKVIETASLEDRIRKLEEAQSNEHSA